MKIRVNIGFTERQYKTICRNAKAAEILPGTWCRLAVLSAAGIEYIPDAFTMPTKIKQLELFPKEKKAV